MARDHRPPGPEHLEHIRAEWQAEAAWWYHPAARDLQAGDQFVTRNGEHRWTKVIAGSKEIWRGPDGLLVGDVFGQLNHYDALLIDRALAQLYAQAIQENGQWKWPEGFDPATFLRQEMGRSVTVVARWLDDPNNGSRDVARFFDPLMASIGGILEPDVPWRLPLQQGYEMDAPDPTREFSALRNQSAPEVLNDTSDRWLWSSSVHTETLGLAYRFSGRYGYIDHAPFNYDGGSVRLVARWR